MNIVAPEIPKELGALRRTVVRAARFCKTIRGQIFVAFLVMTLITGALGAYATLGIKDDGILVRKTYDQSLMAINYARAAAADFANMRAAFARRWIAENPAVREAADHKIELLAKTLKDDLAIAAQRSQSGRAHNAATRVQAAVDAWKAASERLLDKTKLDVNWELLDQHAKKVDEQIDLLINYTAGDGFLYRESAAQTIARDMHLNIAGTIIALLLSGAIAAILTRRIIKPVASASEVANCVATGALDVNIPTGSSDELGALLASMRVMRDNIKSMMEREVRLRHSAQSRLADALEGSQEGIVVIDEQNCIALANPQAVKLLGVAPDTLKSGTPLSQVQSALGSSVQGNFILAHRTAESLATGEFQLDDGRWLRFSQGATRDRGLIVVFGDTTLLKQQEGNLRESKLRLDAALDNMSQGLCLFDENDRLEVVNRRFFEIFGLSREQIEPGVIFSKVLAENEFHSNVDASAANVLLDRLSSHGRRHAGTQYHELGDGRIIASVSNPTASGRWVATFEDVTERRQAEVQIMHMARHDALTDLPNRALFRERMEQALARGESFAVHFVDLDRFKTVNDTLGHPVGDALLCTVTKRLEMAVRGVDTVARLGGDEFAIIQLGAKPSDAIDLAARLIASMSESFEIYGNQIIIGASVGIAMAPTDGTEPDQLLRNSDMALYRAKSEGRGLYHFFEPEMDAQMQARHELETDLRKALAANEFEVCYQPIVSLETGKYVGFEALTRWNHPQHGVIGPDRFIPIAEEIGLILPFGEWVLKKACQDAALWPDDLTVAVNLSAVQFRNPSLALSVATALATAGLSPTRLGLEITETVLLQQDQAIIDTLHQIRSIGVRISMDDFGTGYSSLSYLRSFPFDKIKIDRSFTRELGKQEDCAAIIRAVTRLGSSLGMLTIAEGVETREQLDILRAEGCDQVQGYLFSKAVPAASIPGLLALGNRERAA